MYLTKAERNTLLLVVNERLAGGPDDLADALGIDLDEAEQEVSRLQLIATKLAHSLGGRDRGPHR